MTTHPRLATTTPPDATGEPYTPDVEPAPAWMDPGAQAHWGRLRPGYGDLDESGRAILAGVCDALARYVVARDVVLAEGVTVTGGNGGPVVHPASKVADSAWVAAMRGLATLSKRATRAGATDPAKARFFNRPPTGLAKFTGG